MTIELEFTTLEARDAFMEGSPPDGVRLSIEAANEGGLATTTFIVLSEIIKPLALGLITTWLYDRAVKHDAKRIRVEGREVTNKAEFECSISDKVEVGKND